MRSKPVSQPVFMVRTCSTLFLHWVFCVWSGDFLALDSQVTLDVEPSDTVETIKIKIRDASVLFGFYLFLHVFVFSNKIQFLFLQFFLNIEVSQKKTGLANFFW